MAGSTNFPTTKDDYGADETGGAVIDEDHVNDLRAAVLALETKMGCDATSATSSIDFKISKHDCLFDVGISADWPTDPLPDATYATIEFDTEEFDIGSNFDVANNKFTSPATGYYQFDASLYVNPTRSTLWYNIKIQIDADGDSWTNHYYPPTGTDGYINLKISKLIHLNNGDDVYIKASQGAGTLSTINVTDTWFSGHLVWRG